MSASAKMLLAHVCSRRMPALAKMFAYVLRVILQTPCVSIS